MQVLVFKTNGQTQEQVNRVKALLQPVLSITDWNFDLSDRDRILRVVTPSLPPRFIESLLQTSGLYCQELED